jgi:excisionase family DNA binding protein
MITSISKFNAEDRNEELRQNPPQIMNAKELSVYLGISERKIRSDAATGLLPSVRLGGRVVFRLSDLNKALEKNGKGVCS